MNHIYIIIVDTIKKLSNLTNPLTWREVSQEGYKTWKEAKQFIESRADKPKREANNWVWVSNSHIYKIKEISIK